MIAELKRHNPDLRINKNNTSKDAIKGMFTPLDNAKDIAYVEKKVKELIEHLRLKKAEKDGANNCHQTAEDRLRFVGLFNDPEVYRAYWQSQESPSREELDAGETPSSKFNDLNKVQ